MPTTRTPYPARARTTTIRLLTAAAVLAVSLGSTSASAATSGGQQPGFEIPARSRSEHLRLATSLRDDAAAGRPVLSKARPDHVGAAPRGMVTVVIETTDASATERAVRDHGGTATTVLDEVVEADVPATSLEQLADARGTVLVREPYFPSLDAVSEGVVDTAAAPWHDAGWGGAGAKVAIVDGGFAGYGSLLGTDLPASVDTDFSRCSDPESIEHGTAVTEIVHDMAPDAQLLLVCIEDDVDFRSALSTMAAAGVDVVNGSFGFTLTGRGDGSGGPSTVAGAVASLRDQGILYVAAAGNYGFHHFHTNATGDPVSSGFDDFVNISPDDSFLFNVAGSGEVTVSVQWDAWPRTTQDFDVYVGNNACGLVGSSVEDQASLNLPPVELVTFQSCSSSPMTFELLVDRYSGTASPRIDLYFDGDVGAIEHTSGSSLPEPASSPAALTAGAYCVGNGQRQPYSSQGPSIDGRMKPDLAGPDAVSTATYGPAADCTSGFIGTSASAPHVAGAAALLRSANPDLDVAELQQLLEDNAVDAGVAGNDPLYGAGRLHLPGTPGGAGVPAAQAYTPTGPLRLLDSRPGPLGASESAFGASGRTTPIGGGGTLRLQVAGIAGVPADATAVVLNVTAIAPTAAGYLTVYGDGQRPVASNVNFAAKQTVAVNVTATIAPDDRITIFNYAGSTHVAVDLAGWYGPTGSGGPATSLFNPLPVPTRAIDTRPSQTGYAEGVFGGSGRTTPIGSGQSIAVQIAGLGGVPADATAAIVNVTAVTPTSSGYLTLHPDGSARPVASTINFNRETIANLAVVPLGTGGRVRIFNSLGNTHVIIDVVGVYRPGVGAGYVALDPPTRQLDTRTGTGLRRGPLGANATHKLKVARYDGVPADAVAVSMSVAAIKPTSFGYLTVYPGTKPRPTASNLNFTSGVVLANAVVSALGTDGTVAFTNSAGSTNVIADLAGYFIDPADQPVPLTVPPSTP